MKAIKNTYSIYLLGFLLLVSFISKGMNPEDYFTKKGKFSQDQSFNPEGNKDLTPPDPGDGDDPPPLSAEGGLLIMLAGSTLLLYKIARNKKEKKTA